MCLALWLADFRDVRAISSLSVLVSQTKAFAKDGLGVHRHIHTQTLKNMQAHTQTCIHDSRQTHMQSHSHMHTDAHARAHTHTHRISLTKEHKILLLGAK